MWLLFSSERRNGFFFFMKENKIFYVSRISGHVMHLIKTREKETLHEHLQDFLSSSREYLSEEDCFEKEIVEKN